MESFITVTAHFIDKAWKLVTVNLVTAPFEEKHTAENLLTFLKNQTDSWNITHKVTLAVSDNAANILRALRLSPWDNFGCNAHKLNLIVQNAMKSPHVAELRAKVEIFLQVFYYFFFGKNVLVLLKSSMFTLRTFFLNLNFLI